MFSSLSTGSLLFTTVSRQIPRRHKLRAAKRMSVRNAPLTLIVVAFTLQSGSSSYSILSRYDYVDIED